MGAGLTPAVAGGPAPVALFEAQHAAAVAAGMMAAEQEMGEAASAPDGLQHSGLNSDDEHDDPETPIEPPGLEQAMPLVGQCLPAMGHAADTAEALVLACWKGLNRLDVLMTIASAPEEYGVPKHRVCFWFELILMICMHCLPFILWHCT